MKTQSFLQLRRRLTAGHILVLTILSTLGLGACGGGAKDLDAAPPAAIGPLQRNWLQQEEEARSTIQGLHASFATEGTAWVASYGPNDRIIIYAARFADPTAAQTAVGQMRAALSAGDTPFGTAKEVTVSQQIGYRADGLGTDHFFFSKGSWVIWIQAIARDFDPAINSIVWQPAA